MRTIAAMLGVLLLFAAQSAAITAQDVTPTHGATPPGLPADPVIGDTVDWLDASGDPIARVTVEEAVRGWEDYGESSEPDAGIEYIAFIITVESVISLGTVEVSEFDFTLHDSDGFLWGAALAEAEEGADVAPLGEDVSLESGEKVAFLIVFEVEQGQPLAHLFWQPESGRLITLASLGGF